MIVPGRTYSFLVVISTWGALASSAGCNARESGHVDADATTPDTSAGDTRTSDTRARDAVSGETTTPDADVPDTTAGETTTPDASGADASKDAGKMDVGATDASTPDATPTVTGDLCVPTGMFDFSVHGANFDAWNGLMIRAAAVEPTFGEKAFPAVVRQTTVIASGTFAMACQLSLSHNTSYPSVGLFIDTDGDGRCSPTDLGYESLYFGWVSTIDKALTSPMSGWPAIGGRIGGTSTTPFCAYYGF